METSGNHSQTVLDIEDISSQSIHGDVSISVETNDEMQGAVFTRTEIVEFILDLVQYADDMELERKSILEPSFGNGDFLREIIQRLLSSFTKRHDIKSSSIRDLKDAIRAVEIHKETYETTKQHIVQLLTNEGVSIDDAQYLVGQWLINSDFLLCDLLQQFDFVVGNPPYVRQELISDETLAEYRSRYSTIYDRADLYIPFIEKGLDHLQQSGSLGFICQDRWIKNKYGGPLRKKISSNYHLKYYVDMFETNAFNKEVIAYPAIIVIAKEGNQKTKIIQRPEIDKANLFSIAQDLVNNRKREDIYEIESIAHGSEPWLLDSIEELSVIRSIEKRYPALEKVGCKVGIGIATGCDKVYIGKFESLPVEDEVKLPLITAADIRTGSISWSGNAVINTFNKNGQVISLDRYPLLKDYFETHGDTITKRNIAQRNPTKWFRTIDNVKPHLTKKPKLLIPDISGSLIAVIDKGDYYPNHNIYWVTSEHWDLRALKTVFHSSIALFFISMYSIRMRGGYLRFQAQYLRRLRLPPWNTIEDGIKQHLVDLSDSKDEQEINKVVFNLYNIADVDRLIVEKYNNNSG